MSCSLEYYCIQNQPELESFIQSLFMNRKCGMTDAICFNLCDFIFSLKKSVPEDAFHKTLKVCAENHIFSKDDILTICKLMRRPKKDHTTSERDLQPTNHEYTRVAASYVLRIIIIMETTITSAQKALKMPGMAESWRVMEETTHQLDKLSVRKAMLRLVQAEMDNRETNRIAKLIKGADFRLTATIEELDIDVALVSCLFQKRLKRIALVIMFCFDS